MMSNDYTPAQSLAIKTLDANVSVSAGAGSGKTRVLVERFREIVEQKKAHSDEILAITYTKKATKEMRERVRATFLAKLEEAVPETRAFWQEEVSRLDSANITTIDSLCYKILHENPVEAQLDPNLSVREEDEMAEFKAEILASFMQTSLQAKDADLLEILKLKTLPEVRRMFTLVLAKLTEILAEGDLTKPYTFTPAALETKAEEVLSTLQNLLAVKAVSSKALKAHLDKLEDNLTEFQAAVKAQDLAQIKKLTPTLNFKNNNEVTNFNAAVKDFKSMLIDKLAGKEVRHWEALFKRFAAYYQKAQADKEYYDFAFVSSKALHLLSKEPTVLRRYRDKFKYIMVDEFQDTNLEQKELTYLLAGGKKDVLQDKRLFVVGDGKQSIYRFRGAVVRVFKKVRDDIAQGAGENIIMADNFRSTPQVMAVCNCLFQDLLGQDAKADVMAQDLTAHKPAGPKPEVYVLENIDQPPQVGKEAEARLMALKIKEIVEKDPSLKYGDVAILVAAIQAGEVFANALRQLGISVALTSGKGFYERQEILDCYNLLRFCLNPRYDLPLLGILRSPYFALSDQVLDALCVSKEDKTLWEVLQDSADEKLQAACQKLAKILNAAQTLSLTEVWDTMFHVLQVETTLLGQGEGREKLANVNRLRSMAADLTMKKSATLQDFVQQMMTLRAANVNTEANKVDRGSDAVQIMTIHKSKGLEFPVVVLPALNNRGKNDTAPYRFCEKIGFGLKVKDGTGEEKETSVYTRAKERLLELEKAEKIRQLYVAMTRAEKCLVLSTVKNITTGKKSTTKTVEQWFDAIERVFTQPQNENLVTWQVVQAQNVPLLTAAPQQEVKLVVPDSTYAKIAPVAGFGETLDLVYSATSLQEYELCHRRFYYNHVAKMPMLEVAAAHEANGKVNPATLGSVVHRALELSREIALDAALERALKEIEASSSQKNRLQAIAYDLLLSYTQSTLYQEIKDLPQEAEKEFNLPLLNLPQGTVSFTGSVDCLLKYPDGTLGIIDFKTGKPPALGEEKEGYTRQLVIYALAMEKLYAVKVSKAQLHFLQDNSSWSLPLARQAEEVKLQNLLTTLVTKKNEQDFTVLPTNCTHCPYSYFCKKV